MKLKKTLLILCTVVLLVSLLVGCGKNSIQEQMKNRLNRSKKLLRFLMH